MRVPKVETRHRLKIARESAGYDRKAEEFAQSLGLSRQTVVSYERGHSTPDRRTVMAWSVVTEVPVWWLDGRDGPMAPAAAGAAHGEELPRMDSNHQSAGYRTHPGIASLADKRRAVEVTTWKRAA